MTWHVLKYLQATYQEQKLTPNSFPSCMSTMTGSRVCNDLSLKRPGQLGAHPRIRREWLTVMLKDRVVKELLPPRWCCFKFDVIFSTTTWVASVEPIAPSNPAISYNLRQLSMSSFVSGNWTYRLNNTSLPTSMKRWKNMRNVSPWM